ncbi:WD repeat-containing protein 81-like [Dendronephthya gigantea]|uniref:WD repeat-containing protein 81-like n=1 Tax=Dendronephthya gigantea TaxID=151771 RepID=UPI00106C50DC|nr:WD repeat-containing protein 81-like [Dendronephthya gigantea]
MQTKQNGHPIAKNTSANDQVVNSQRLEFPDTARHNEIQNLCTMLMEMFLPAKMRLLPCDLTQKERFHMAKKVFSAGKFAIPGILRDGVKTLFEEGCGLHKRHGFPPLTPELLLQQHVNIIPFPSYFKKLYEFLVEFNLGNPETSSLTKGNKNCEKFALTNNLSDLSYISRQVEIAVRHLPDLLTDLNGEGLDLLISYLRPLFANENTQLQAFLHLFEPLAARLGPQRTKKTFLKQLLKHYDVRASNASVLLFHQSFLSKLIVRFGMDQFLDHFLSFIVDALNSSNRDPQVNVDTCSQEEVQGAVLEDDKDPVPSDAGEAQNELSEKSNGENGESSGQNIEHANESGDVSDKSKNQAYSEPGTAASRPSEKSSGIAEAGDQTYESRKDATANFDENTCIENSGKEKCDRLDLEPGVDTTDCAYDINFYPKSGNIQEDFLSDDEEEYGYENDVDEDDDEVGTIEKNDAIFNRSFPTVARRDSDDDWERIADSDFSLERSVSFHSEHLEDDKEDVEIIDNAMEREIPEAAAESICCFTPRLGPLLTSNHIIKPLLGLLVKCYVGVVGLGDKGMLIGDTNAKWILRCIRSCAEVYGEAVVVHQYLPFVMSKINISSEHVSVKGEANLAGALVLVREYITCISQDSLLQQFEMLCYQALDLVLCLISSATITFASEAPARTFLALLILDILQVVCEIFERPSAQDLLSPLIATLFSCFEFGSTPTSPNKDSSPGQPCADEIRETFNASLAYNLYITLCKCLGDTYMTATLDKNNEMIWQLCCSVDKALSNHTPKAMTPTDTEPKPKPFDSESSYLAEPETRKVAKSASLERSDAFQQEKRAKTTFVSSRQHLTGNWLKYWKSHLGKRKKIDGDSFSQLKLQTFAGHSDVVKDIHIQDSEHLFLSASRDKTVKLWLLNNHGDGTGQSACSWTTYDHRKPVFAVDVIDVMRQAVSCDGSVHFWDIPTGSSVLKLKFQKSKEAVAMATLPCPSPCLVTGMQNSTVRFIDSREGNFGHTWKVTSNGLAGNIRSLCVTQDGTSMAVGFSSGSLSLVDLRGGILTRQWKAHEAEIIQVKPYTNSSYVTSSSTQKMELWGNDAVSLCSLPTVTGSGETIQSIQIHDKVIVSLAGNNRIAWHTFTDKEPTYTHLRLGSDVFKGNMTCFGVLPLNRGYLLGSDNGNITLMG